MKVGDDFEMPPAGVLRVHVEAEICTAVNFENDNLRINFIIRLPPGMYNVFIADIEKGLIEDRGFSKVVLFYSTFRTLIITKMSTKVRYC